jgi:hypothetical protein
LSPSRPGSRPSLAAVARAAVDRRDSARVHDRP